MLNQRLGSPDSCQYHGLIRVIMLACRRESLYRNQRARRYISVQQPGDLAEAEGMHTQISDDAKTKSPPKKLSQRTTIADWRQAAGDTRISGNKSLSANSLIRLATRFTCPVKLSAAGRLPSFGQISGGQTPLHHGAGTCGPTIFHDCAIKRL